MSIQFENILYPTDFSEVAQGAVAYARELTRAFGARLHCLHVIDEAYQYWSALGPESIPVGPPPEDMMELAGKRMAKFRTEYLADLDTPAITHVCLGRPYAEIVEYARQQKIDIIVMATHGRGAVAHLLLGSTTEKVVRKAHCPVLTVRPDGEVSGTP